MTEALDDLQTATSLFSTILQNEDVELDEFDYVEFLEDTLPALGERIERETLDMAFRQYIDLDEVAFLGWCEDMGVSYD